jgi:predicted dinucleotide-binding enzyme
MAAQPMGWMENRVRNGHDAAPAPTSTVSAMRIGVLGTGTVGTTIGSRLAGLGHDVMLGSRTADNEAATAWAAESGGSHGTFADAAAHGELVFNCTNGAGSLAALEAAGSDNLAGKTLVDVSNPLDFSQGFPPSLSVCNTDSLAEQIQRAHPDAKVVKALNTMNAAVMVDPSLVHGEHEVLVAGDDDGAKEEAKALLAEFGWPQSSILDLGGLTAARGLEMWLPLWLRLYGAVGTGTFNLHVAR